MCFDMPLSSDIILLKLFLLFFYSASRISSESITYAIRLWSNIANQTISLFISKISYTDLTFDIRAIN